MHLPFTIIRGAATSFAFLALAACSSKKDDPAVQPTPGMSWTVDGATVKTTNLQSQKNGATLSVAGTQDLSNTSAGYIALEIPTAMGTYTFSPTATASAVYSASSPRMVYYAGASSGNTVTGAGTIVVTALSSTNITGTFTFTGIESTTGASKSITNGTFNVGL
jgi:hypothetical protein